MRRSTPLRVTWISGVLLLSAFGPGATAEESASSGAQEFSYQLERAQTQRHPNFQKAVSLLENEFANASDDEELKSLVTRALFADGAALFRSGDPDGALIRFRKGLSYEPTPETAHRVLGDLDPKVQLEMLVRGGDFRAVVRELDGLRKEGGDRPSAEDTALNEEAGQLARELVSSGPERRWEVQQKLLSLGELSIPHLMPWLANERDTELRSYVMATLNRMRGDAVLPIIRGLDSASEFQRVNVAIVLGNIGDARALAALQRAVEGRNESERVKREAKKAAASILAGTATQSAVDLYWRKALDYYHQKEALMRSFDSHWIVWRWDSSQGVTGNVSGEDVTRYAYNERLAEQTLLDLLALPVDANTQSTALALLVSVYINQYQEAMNVATLANDQGAEDFDSVKQSADALEQAMVLARVGGSKLLAAAIARSVMDGYAQTSIGAIDCLEAIDGDIEALSPALTASDKRVRYRASTAALRMNPSGRDFPNRDQVIPNLVDALGEIGTRAVLVIEPDTSVRNTVISQLRELGVNGYGAADGISGLARATQYPKADLVFVSDTLPDIDARTVASRLRQDYRTAGTPVAILSDPGKVGMNDSDFVSKGLAARVISRDTNKALLQAQLDFLLEKAGEMDSGRLAANAAAQAAAEALAAVDPMATTYPLQQAVPGLLGSAEGQTDPVRVPALRALRKFGDASAARVVTAVLTDSSSSIAAKSAAAEALGAIYKRSGSIPREAVTILVDLIANRDTDLELRRAAGVALGQAPLSPQQRIDVMTTTVLHPLPRQ